MGFVEFKKLKSIEGRGELFNLFKSVNLSQVSISGIPPAQARAYIFMLERNHMLYPFVYLYFPEFNRGRFFIFEEGAVEIKKEGKAKEEALNFVESMGFMMEEIELLHLPSQELKELKKTLPFYYEDLEQFKKFMEQIEGEVERSEETGESDEVEVEIEEPQEEKVKEKKSDSEAEIPQETKFIIKSLIDKYGLGRIPQINASEQEAEVVEVEEDSTVEEVEVIESKKFPPNMRQIVARFLASG